MRVTLLETTETPVGFHVRFNCEFGTGAGLWHGSTPWTSAEYDVELEVPGVLLWGRDLAAGPDAAPMIFSGQDTTHLCAQLESVSDDGVIALRLGTSIVRVETSGDKAPLGT